MVHIWQVHHRLVIFKWGAARYPMGLSFAGSQLDQTRHVCAFFNSADEHYRVSLPFVKDGFQCGHKAIYVVNPNQGQGHLQHLAELEVDLAVTQQNSSPAAP